MAQVTHVSRRGDNMPKQPNTQPKKKIFVNVPLKDEEEQTIIRIVAARKNKSMAEYIRDLVRADLMNQHLPSGAGQ
jgi:hypothetical protein